MDAQQDAEYAAEPTEVRPEPSPFGPVAPGPRGIELFARDVIQANQAEFLRAARGQRFAFATMKWLFLVVFMIALGAMIAAVRIATDVPEEGYNWAHAGVVGGVALMAIILFALLLYMRPLAALERNAVVNSFLSVVVNSYWTRLLYVNEAADIDVHLEDATAYTVEHLGALLDRQLLGASRYMDLVRKAQDEAGQDPSAYATPL
jgi:ABC-type multidrug transport system fused ATPase/permease subunit